MVIQSHEIFFKLKLYLMNIKKHNLPGCTGWAKNCKINRVNKIVELAKNKF